VVALEEASEAIPVAAMDEYHLSFAPTIVVDLHMYVCELTPPLLQVSQHAHAAPLPQPVQFQQQPPPPHHSQVSHVKEEDEVRSLSLSHSPQRNGLALPPLQAAPPRPNPHPHARLTTDN
jgi:hypothetical protein